MEKNILNKLSKEGRNKIIYLEGKLREVEEEINFLRFLDGEKTLL